MIKTFLSGLRYLKGVAIPIKQFLKNNKLKIKTTTIFVLLFIAFIRFNNV